MARTSRPFATGREGKTVRRPLPSIAASQQASFDPPFAGRASEHSVSALDRRRVGDATLVLPKCAVSASPPDMRPGGWTEEGRGASTGLVTGAISRGATDGPTLVQRRGGRMRPWPPTRVSGRPRRPSSPRRTACRRRRSWAWGGDGGQVQGRHISGIAPNIRR